jgi:hypothetical protein
VKAQFRRAISNAPTLAEESLRPLEEPLIAQLTQCEAGFALGHPAEVVCPIAQRACEIFWLGGGVRLIQKPLQAL